MEGLIFQSSKILLSEKSCIYFILISYLIERWEISNASMPKDIVADVVSGQKGKNDRDISEGLLSMVCCSGI